MPRQRTACFTCASIKTACSRGHPCRRCERLSLTCSYAVKCHRTRAETDAGEGTSRCRVTHRRSRNGCVNCLQRRKKCDEEFPVCRECRRLGLENCHPRNSSPSSSTSPRDWQTASTPGSEGSQTVASSIRLDQNDSALDFNVNEYLAHVASMPERNLAGIPRRGHLNESNALKSRKKNGYNTNVELTVNGNVHLGNIIHLAPAGMADFEPTEQHLLLHYVQHVSRALAVVNDDENPFLHEILPMAMEVKSVRHAMLALTACHLCKVYPKFEDTLIRQHSLALQHLKQDLQSETKAGFTLTTSLLLCLFGICHGNSPKWILHLYGAKVLVDLHLAGGLPIAPSKFVLDLYEFICCKTRITCDRVPVERIGFPSTLLSTGDSQVHIHPLFGLAGDLYHILNLISQLAMDKNKQTQTPGNEDEFLLEARRIETSLQEWIVPIEVDHHNTRLVRDAAIAAEAIRWTALIRLHQVMGGTFRDESKLQTAVENILSAVSCISPGSSVDSQLLLPVFMAGISAVRKSARLQLEYRLSLLESTIGMGNIAGAHQLLDLFWEHNRERDVDWEDLLKREHPYVIFY
ncbi:hypothetical protein P175DRAFT_0341800 [Aspergillus ochraceoroseus IBT 24754]|uniref:Zn(2)-C6 fungal-type domain-containing protein n=2 Tax=Aspergillus ochraceoroseus TaxID=138278 RepID=A0A2T5LRU2_9EURO|nr:uncharacterized protein P175DRAFT_0341800 [Aspergillus ochraceoroseus IBT 24754]KKK14660.1 hypothetical protein AOCH_001098 [Aspergillus ochraceoroseus]PTU18991.1 hypothetical protein P175DRAFT_0341800 [Aspergillus ochraceoroseus IBT 24754]